MLRCSAESYKLEDGTGLNQTLGTAINSVMVMVKPKEN